MGVSKNLGPPLYTLNSRVFSIGTQKGDRPYDLKHMPLLRTFGSCGSSSFSGATINMKDTRPINEDGHRIPCSDCSTVLKSSRKSRAIWACTKYWQQAMWDLQDLSGCLCVCLGAGGAYCRH